MTIIPRWHVPGDPDVAAIREADTDWNRWLLGKPYVPFDPWKYFEFRIFRDYSGGITSQWMSHGAGLVHFYTDTAIPDSMVANGGIFGWPDIRQNPDTFQALATYDDAKLLYSYTSNYASMFGDYTCIRGKQGTLFAHGGEGSSRWFFIPEHQDLPGGFDFYEGMKETVKSGKAEIVTTEEYGMKLGPVNVSDNSKYHLDNWIDCMRNRNMVPNGHIHTGFWHSVASIMATRAYREGRKLYWDRSREEIVDHPVISLMDLMYCQIQICTSNIQNYIIMKTKLFLFIVTAIIFLSDAAGLKIKAELFIPPFIIDSHMHYTATDEWEKSFLDVYHKT